MSQISLPAPTPGEARIRKALAEPTTFDFDEQPLLDVASYVREKHQMQVRLDNEALSEAGVGVETPITIKLDDISLRSALRLVLRELDLTFVVRDGYLLITSITEAENNEDVRVYPVGDLVTIDGQPASPRESDYQALADLIPTTVSPTCWEFSGPSPLRGYYPGRGLIISQSPDIHDEIETFLSALRAARDEQYKLAEHPRAPEPAKEDETTVTMTIYHLGPSIFGMNTAGLRGAELPEHSPILAQMGLGGMGLGGMRVEGAASGPVDAKQFATWAGELADLLPQLIEPASWESSGGSGMVRAFASSLIVKQTGAVHREIVELLAQLLPGRHTPCAVRRGPIDVPSR